VVGGRVEYLPAIIATSDHVIQTTGDFDASLPSHGWRMLLRTNLAVNTLRHACCWQRVYSDMDKLCIESIVNFGKFREARIAQIASLTPVWLVLSERLSIISRSIEPVSIKQKSAAWP